MKVLVTGANGFVGRAVCADLARRGHEVVAAVRAPDRAREIACARAVSVGEIGSDTPWRGALRGIEAVVHAAARVHQTRKEPRDALARYSRVNVEGTRVLADAAAAAGARRMILLSTVKVLGETTEGRAPFSEADPANPDPRDPYALSKRAAEEALFTVAARTGLEAVAVRPPLVYGPGVRANFAALIRLVRSGLPLPLASVANRRSLVYLGNLADALALCLTHPAAAGEIFLLRDGEDVSVPELIRKIAAADGRSARLFPFPPGLLRALATAAGRGKAAARLLDSLAVDDRKLRDRLGWRPPFSMAEGLARTVRPAAGDGSEGTASA